MYESSRFILIHEVYLSKGVELIGLFVVSISSTSYAHTSQQSSRILQGCYKCILQNSMPVYCLRTSTSTYKISSTKIISTNKSSNSEFCDRLQYNTYLKVRKCSHHAFLVTRPQVFSSTSHITERIQTTLAKA